MISPTEISAGMVKAPTELPSGEPLESAGLDAWITALRPFRTAGFRSVEVHNGWLGFPTFTPSQTAQLRDALLANELTTSSLAIARKSVIDPGDGERNLQYNLAGLDVAYALGASVLCVGLHPVLTEEQRKAGYFWLAPGHADPTDSETWSTAVQRLRAIGRRAEDLGLLISLEIYEDTLLGTAESALRLVDDIDLPNVGINPDIGNLLRLDREVDDWRSLLSQLLPASNYWHVKNYTREARGDGFNTSPTTLAGGIIDYPEALGMAHSVGFDGIIVCEQYSDDWLQVLAENRAYLEALLTDSALPRAAEEPAS